MKTLVVEKEKIKKNLRLIYDRAGDARVIGVLKGNGYGLGLLELARVIRDEGVTCFGVTEPLDALKLRHAGFTDEEILVLRSTAIPEEIEMIFEACATATIGSYEAAVAVNGIAKESGRVTDAHIEIDTGMGRYGFLPTETDRILSVYRFMDNINITGVYTHFHSAFSSERVTLEQYTKLASVVEAIKSAGFNPGLIHAANSSALFRYSLQQQGGVRVGSAITGRIAAKGGSGLSRVGYLEADVVEVRWLPEKHPVGYGAAFVTKKPTRIAVVAAGYGDGYLVSRQNDIFRFRDNLRGLGNALKTFIAHKKNTVTINGSKARVLGHAGLAHLTVDVTNIDCQVGDKAILDVSPLMVDSSIPRRYI